MEMEGCDCLCVCVCVSVDCRLQSERLITAYLPEPGTLLTCSSGCVTPLLITVSPRSYPHPHSHSHSLRLLFFFSLPMPISTEVTRCLLLTPPETTPPSLPPKMFILRWLALTVLAFKWYFLSGGTTFPPERISFWNVFLFEIGDDTNIFIPFHSFASRKVAFRAGATESKGK